MTKKFKNLLDSSKILSVEEKERAWMIYEKIIWYDRLHERKCLALLYDIIMIDAIKIGSDYNIKKYLLLLIENLSLDTIEFGFDGY